MSELMTASERFRDRINRHPLIALLIARGDDWDVLTTSLDLIQWCDLAFDEYQTIAAQGRETLRFLHVFGVLQAAVVQQDTARTLADSIGCRLDWKDSRLKHIRDVRIAAIGHPVDPKRGRACLFLHEQPGRLSLLDRAEDWSGVSPNRTLLPVRDLNLRDLILAQRQAIRERLDVMNSHLDSMRDAAAEVASEQRFASFIPTESSYWVEKLGDGLFVEDWFMAETAIRKLHEFLGAIRTEFDRRKWALSAYPGIDHSIRNLSDGLSLIMRIRNADVEVEAGARALLLDGFASEFLSLCEMLRDTDEEDVALLDRTSPRVSST